MSYARLHDRIRDLESFVVICWIVALDYLAILSTNLFNRKITDAPAELVMKRKVTYFGVAASRSAL